MAVVGVVGEGRECGVGEGGIDARQDFETQKTYLSAGALLAVVLVGIVVVMAAWSTRLGASVLCVGAT